MHQSHGRRSPCRDDLVTPAMQRQDQAQSPFRCVPSALCLTPGSTGPASSFSKSSFLLLTTGMMFGRTFSFLISALCNEALCSPSREGFGMVTRISFPSCPFRARRQSSAKSNQSQSLCFPGLCQQRWAIKGLEKGITIVLVSLPHWCSAVLPNLQAHTEVSCCLQEGLWEVTDYSSCVPINICTYFHAGRNSAFLLKSFFLLWYTSIWKLPMLTDKS